MTNPDQKANEAIEELSGLVHSNAKEELQKNIELARQWLALRFAELPGLTPESKVSLGLNEWNKTHSLGLQSVSIEVKNDDEPLLFNLEWQSPTIGIITPGMVEGDVVQAEMDFEIEDKKAEDIRSLSNDPFYMTQASIKHGQSILNRDFIHSDEKMSVFGKICSVRTILEMKDAPREKIRNIINRGVYGCRFAELPS